MGETSTTMNASVAIQAHMLAVNIAGMRLHTIPRQLNIMTGQAPEAPEAREEKGTCQERGAREAKEAKDARNMVNMRPKNR